MLAGGAYRVVFRCGRFAVKLPRPRNLLSGMRCNQWEREVSRVWQPRFRWKSLCPVLVADPFGLCVVMPRARQPVTEAQMLAASAEDADAYPAPDFEFKVDDWGILSDGRVVAVDYGLWDAESVRETRAYYRERYRSMR